MLEISIVNKTSQEANWNGWTGRQAGRQTDGQDHVLSQADALTKKKNVKQVFNTSPSIWAINKHFQCNVNALVVQSIRVCPRLINIS